MFDSRANIRLIAGLSLARTFFVCLVLAIGSYLFRKDANQVIIGPVLNMVEKIRRIADNPLEAASLEYNEQLEKEKIEEDIKRKAA